MDVNLFNICKHLHLFMEELKMFVAAQVTLPCPSVLLQSVLAYLESLFLCFAVLEFELCYLGLATLSVLREEMLVFKSFKGYMNAGRWVQSVRPLACGGVKLLASALPLTAIFWLRSPCGKGIV